jgi:hypothetical protein
VLSGVAIEFVLDADAFLPRSFALRPTTVECVPVGVIKIPQLIGESRELL